MNDEILQEVWRVKDEISAEHEYDVMRLVREMRSRESASNSRVVDLHADRQATMQGGNQPFNPSPATGSTKGW